MLGRNHEAGTTATLDPPPDRDTTSAPSIPQPQSPTIGVDAETITRTAAEFDKWRRRNAFYHERIAEYVRFAVPEGESVLVVGCDDGGLLSALKPARGVGVDRSQAMIELARRRNPRFTYVSAADYSPSLEGTFEYIVLLDIMGEVHDLFAFLQGIAKLCTPTSRILLIQHNYLWRPILRAASWLG